jgi:hypothetical protein
MVSLQLAGTARAVFANPLPVVDAAGAGTVLLAQVQSIHATSAWLVPFKFFGMATEFLAIVMGLGTIAYVLKAQTEMFKKSIQISRSNKVQEVMPVEKQEKASTVETVAA